MADVTLFDRIRVGIASPEDTLAWSHGEVKKPETINYRTFKPERDGLFCERIFGPTKDWECHCGRYKKVKFKGMVCERCGVEVTRSRVRRERMGHIELAAPVCHIWFLKGVPSPIGLLLNISPRDLEKVVYFGSFIVIEIDRETLDANREEIEASAELAKKNIQQELAELEEEIRTEFANELEQNKEEYDEAVIKERTKAVNDRIKAEQRDAEQRINEIDVALEVLYKLEPNMLIEEDKYRAVDRLLHAVSKITNENYNTMLRAGIGAAAVKELLQKLNLDTLARELKAVILKSTGPKRARAIRRLEIVEAFLHSKSRPEWMILDVLPVISPELRPMVQLDGGRFATSDLNDLYRRIINRNNRLKKIIDIRAPESIVNHEKRLLQESVDALIDNGRRTKPVVGTNNRPLKSLSDMLKGKEGRFRKNLLGKRVDYSGRAVIVVGPHLKINQCGLPKEMALELFKPYVMNALVTENDKQNIKTAKKMIDRMHPAVWDALEKVIQDHPVLLNRAPTLHRFGIQGFEPILVDGKAIQIPPLVCPPYNADFDGDQMAVHVPLSAAAQAEARILMLSSNNLFSPANGHPTMAPMQDIVLGCYALTVVNKEAKRMLDEQLEAHRKNPTKNPPPKHYASPDEAILLAMHPDTSVRIPLNSPVFVRIKRDDPEKIKDENYIPETVIREMTPGQMLFHEILPHPFKYHDDWCGMEMNKRNLTNLISAVRKQTNKQTVVKMLDDIKELGFKWATFFGLTITLSDVDPKSAPSSDRSLVATKARRAQFHDHPSEYNEEVAQRYQGSRLADLIKDRISEGQEQTRAVRKRYEDGVINRNNRDGQLMRIWGQAFKDLSENIIKEMGQFNPLRMMVDSGARGSREQLVQLMATRGMFRNNFNQAITDIVGGNGLFAGSRVFEYFVSMYGTRKGVTDTALLMGYSGYIARRLVDVSHDVVIRTHDCGTTSGVYVSRIIVEKDEIEKLAERIYGRTSLDNIYDPRRKTKTLLVEANQPITEEIAKEIGEIEAEYNAEYQSASSGRGAKEKIAALESTYRKAGFRIGDHGELQVAIRSPLTCELEKGICSKCYGWDLSTSEYVEKGVAVGVIAAESMSEPLSQLTMRTFHHGGVATGQVLTGYTQAGRMYGILHEELKADITREEETQHLPDFVSEQRTVIESILGGKEKEEPEEEKKTKAKTAKKESTVSDAKPMGSIANRALARELVEHSMYHYVGIPFVERLLEARLAPKGEAVITRYDGKVVKIQSGKVGKWVVIEAVAPIYDEQLPGKTILETVKDPETGAVIVSARSELTRAIVEKIAKTGKKEIKILETLILPKRRHILVNVGDQVRAGDPITQGPLALSSLLEFRGVRAIQEYLIRELQNLYKSNGVHINDRHLEIICRQMLRKVRIRDSGSSSFLPGQVVDRFVLRNENERIQAMIEAGEKVPFENPETGETEYVTPTLATADPIIQGITDAALTTESFLSAASAQKTVKVLTEAAVRGKVDELVGLKENVIIGRLIPAGSGFPEYRNIQPKATREPEWTLASQTALASVAQKEIEQEEIDENDVGDIASLAQSLDADLSKLDDYSK